MDFYERFVSLCNRSGKSPSKVAQEIGISKSIVSRWKNGGGVTDATAMKIAEYFEVPVSTLIDKVLPGTMIGEDFKLSIDEIDLPEVEDTKKPTDNVDGLRGLGYYDLTPENQKVIDALIETLLNSQSRG